MALTTNDAQAVRAGVTEMGLTENGFFPMIFSDNILAAAWEIAQPVPCHLNSVTLPDFRRK